MAKLSESFLRFIKSPPRSVSSDYHSARSESGSNFCPEDAGAAAAPEPLGLHQEDSLSIGSVQPPETKLSVGLRLRPAHKLSLYLGISLNPPRLQDAAQSLSEARVMVPTNFLFDAVGNVPPNESARFAQSSVKELGSVVRRVAVNAAINSVQPEQVAACVHNWALGFAAAAAAGTPPFVLDNAMRWLAMQANVRPGKRGKEAPSEHIIRGQAAAALEVHDIFSKNGWKITRTHGGLNDTAENRNAFVGLIKLFEQLEGETEVEYARLCGLWMQMPEFLRGIVSLHMVDAADLKFILLNFGDIEPKSIELAEFIIQHKCGHILLRSRSNSAELQSRSGNAKILADFRKLTRGGGQQMSDDPTLLAAWNQLSCSDTDTQPPSEQSLHEAGCLSSEANTYGNPVSTTLSTDPGLFVHLSVAQRRAWETGLDDAWSELPHLVRELGKVQSDPLRNAILASIPLVPVGQAGTCVGDWSSGFAAAADNTEPTHLRNAVIWLALHRNGEDYDLNVPHPALSSPQGRAAAALEVCNISERRNWEVSRITGSQIYTELQTCAYDALLAIFAKLEKEATVDYARLSALWVRVPKFLYTTIQETFLDAADLEQILTALVAERPGSLPDAENIIRCHSGRRLLNVCFYAPGNYASPKQLLLLAEFRDLGAERRVRLDALREPLRVWLLHRRASPQLVEFLAEQEGATSLKQIYAKMPRPNEGGAARLTTESLNNSLTILEPLYSLGDPLAVFVQLQEHVHYFSDGRLDSSDRFKRTLRQRAAIAVEGLWQGKRGQKGPLLYESCGRLSPFGVAALVWAVIQRHPELAERPTLRYSFIMALSRCLDDAEESAECLPSVNCWRGYAEQLLLILSGFYKPELPLEGPYSHLRGRDFMYRLGAETQEESGFENRSPDEVKNFHVNAMRECVKLIRESHGDSDCDASRVDRLEELRVAFHALRETCGALGYERPGTEVAELFGVKFLDG